MGVGLCANLFIYLGNWDSQPPGNQHQIHTIASATGFIQDTMKLRLSKESNGKSFTPCCPLIAGGARRADQWNS